LAAVVLLALVAIRLPGHGATAAVALAAATAAAAVVVARRGVEGRPLIDALPTAVAVLAICSLPFIANDRVGELGAYVLEDLAGHMAQADAMRTLGGGAHVTSAGYPTGPHAVVATLEAGLGIGAGPGFTGLLLAAPILTALTALGALGGARWYLRVPAAALTGVAYLAVSYLAEGSFKEPLLALLFLGFVLGLSERRTLPLLLMAAASVAVFGVSGLAWPAAVLVWLAILELLHGRGRELWRWRPDRRLALGIGAAAAAAATALALGARAFFETGPGQHLTHKGSGGNFHGQLSPLEALGVWRQEDFRVGMAHPLLEPGVLLACAVVGFGLVWCWRRREWTLVAGALAGCSIYAVARPVTLAYFSGKALAVVAPLLTLIAVRALALSASGLRRAPVRLAPVAAAAGLAAFVLVAGASSALALRGARVRPHDRGGDLAAFRSLVQGKPTLYLAHDNWARWELRGAELSGFQSYNSPLSRELTPVPAKATPADALKPAVDSDSVDPSLLASVRYLIVSRTAYASVLPSGFVLVRRTPWHELWQRRGAYRPRQTLAEGEAPGRVLDCATPDGRRLARRGGVAFVRPRPVVGLAAAWRPPNALNGQSRTQVLQLPPGRWDISLRWFSDVPLRLHGGSLGVTLPAYLGDPSTFATAGRVDSSGGPLRVTVDVPARRRLATLRTVELGTLAATRADSRGHLVPLARACGRYVDWYRVR
jgi:hypothetical protein